MLQDGAGLRLNHDFLQQLLQTCMPEGRPGSSDKWLGLKPEADVSAYLKVMLCRHPFPQQRMSNSACAVSTLLQSYWPCQPAVLRRKNADFQFCFPSQSFSQSSTMKLLPCQLDNPPWCRPKESCVPMTAHTAYHESEQELQGREGRQTCVSAGLKHIPKAVNGLYVPL